MIFVFFFFFLVQEEIMIEYKGNMTLKENLLPYSFQSLTKIMASFPCCWGLLVELERRIYDHIYI